MVGGLAEEEAQLFEGLGEGILARHGGMVSSQLKARLWFQSSVPSYPSAGD